MSASSAGRLRGDLVSFFLVVGLAVCSLSTGSAQSVPTLLLPVAVTYDSTGNLFFADARRHQVFELTLAGIWSVVAGTGEQGFAGDGGPSTDALLDTPRGLAVAADGTLYITDSGNQRIRAVVNGKISTVAGSGMRGYSGDGIALQAALRDPAALAVDAAGNLLVCDTGNQRVRRIAGGRIATIAGTGVQGSGGEGGAATAAELDTPLGVAVGAAGTVYIADTHNHRVLMLSTSGTLSVFAGTGSRGFTGDGGPATSASLDLPYGVAVASDGSVLIADTGNQVIRSVSTGGVIRTVAGNGVQGSHADAALGTAASLNSPRAIGVQLQGQPVFADSANRAVGELANDNALYTLALLASPHVSTVTLSAGASSVYGQAMVSVNVNGLATPQGAVLLSEGESALASAQLTAGRASFDLSKLAAGTHAITAAYAGDGLNGAANSTAVSMTVTAAPATAVADSTAAAYGASIPAFTGRLTGILPQDVGNVHAVFSSTAGALAPPGVYPISAVLTGQGSANYSLTIGADSGSLTVTTAPSLTTISSPATTYVGLPLLLSAAVTSTTSGAPGGTIDFLEGNTVLGSSPVVNGLANTSVLPVAGGAHSYAARYNGDTNFRPSLSNATSVAVAAVPDFALSLGSASQFVQGGSAAVFTVNVSPENGPFTGAVVLHVTGLPQGATAAFSPVSVVPGASTATATLSIQTVARSGALHQASQMQWAFVFGFPAALCCIPVRRRKGSGLRSMRSLSLLGLVVLWTCAGCGTRTTETSVPSGQTFSLTIQGTGTNLVGAVVTRNVTGTLTVY